MRQKSKSRTRRKTKATASRHHYDVAIVRDPEATYPSGLRIEGAKAIIVDGKKWGAIEMDRLGRHGTCYFFHQEGKHGRIEVDDHQVRVYSDRHHRREEDQWRRLPERLLQTARDLVQRGKLRNPIIVRKEIERANAKAAARRAKKQLREERRWNQVAGEALDKAMKQRSSKPILKAMKWAKLR